MRITRNKPGPSPLDQCLAELRAADVRATEALDEVKRLRDKLADLLMQEERLSVSMVDGDKKVSATLVTPGPAMKINISRVLDYFKDDLDAVTTRAFDKERFEAQLDLMDKEARDALITEAVTEQERKPYIRLTERMSDAEDRPYQV